METFSVRLSLIYFSFFRVQSLKWAIIETINSTVNYQNGSVYCNSICYGCRNQLLKRDSLVSSEVILQFFSRYLKFF